MLYDDPVAYVAGLQIYRDFSNPKLYYFLPPEAPRIARVAEGDDYALRLVLFRPDPNAAPPEGMEDGGGFLNLDVDLAVSDAQLDRAKQELAAKFGDDAELVPVPFTKGSVELLLLGVGREDEGKPFVRKVAGSAVPSLYGTQRAAFSVVLDRNGAALMRQVLAEGGLTMALAIYHLEYAAIGPAYNLKITIDYSRVQETMDLALNASLSAGSGNSKFVGKAGFHMLMESLKENRAVVVEEVDPVPGENGQSQVNQERINDIIRNLMGSTWFRPSLSQVSQLTQPQAARTTSSSSSSASSSSSSTTTAAPSTTTAAPSTTTAAPSTTTPAPTGTGTGTAAQPARANATWTVDTKDPATLPDSELVSFTASPSGVRETLVINGSPERVVIDGNPYTLEGNQAQVDVPAGQRVNVEITWPAEQPEGPVEPVDTTFFLFFGFSLPTPGSPPPNEDDYKQGRVTQQQDARYHGVSKEEGGSGSGPAALQAWLGSLDPSEPISIDGHASYDPNERSTYDENALSQRRIDVAQHLITAHGTSSGRSYTTNHQNHGEGGSQHDTATANPSPRAIPLLTGDSPGLQTDGHGDTSFPAHRVAVLKGRKPGQAPQPIPRNLTGHLHRPSPGPTPTPEPTPTPTPTPPPGGESSTEVQASFEINFEMIQREEKITASYDLSSRKALKREIHPQGQLAFESDDPMAYIIEADGAIDFFQWLQLEGTTTANWEGDGIDSIQIEIRYGPRSDGDFMRRGEMLLRADQPKGSWKVGVVHEGDDDSKPVVYWYEYRVTVHYRPEMALGDQSGAVTSVGAEGADAEGWLRSYARNLVIHPRDVTPAVTVNVLSGVMKYDLLERVQLGLSYGPYHQNLALTADTPQHRLVIRPEPDLDDHTLRTDGTLFYKDGAQVPLPPQQWSAQEMVVINEPRQNMLRVRVIMADPGDEFVRILVRLRYEHGTRLLEQELELTEHAQLEEWAVRLEDPEQRSWQYQATLFEKSGAIRDVPWTDGEEEQLVVGIEAVDVIPVQVTWLMVPPLGELLAVKIDLAYDDDRLDVHWEHSELIRPGHSGTFSWSIAIRDKALRGYRYRVTEFRATGPTAGQWHETEDTMLVLLPGV